MTDKERLEEIKNVRWENLKTSQILHVKWLIEQAERVQELEELEKAFGELDSDYIDLQEENKRYREIIQDFIDYADDYNIAKAEKYRLRKALESESE